EIRVRESALQAVDSHDQARALGGGDRAPEKSGRATTRRRFAARCDRVLKVDDDGVGIARQCLVELAVAVGGRKQKRAHDGYFGRIRMKAWRRHSATSLLSWL